MKWRVMLKHKKWMIVDLHIETKKEKVKGSQNEIFLFFTLFGTAAIWMQEWRLTGLFAGDLVCKLGNLWFYSQVPIFSIIPLIYAHSI